MAQVTIHQLLTSVLGQSVESAMDEVVLGQVFSECFAFPYQLFNQIFCLIYHQVLL
jgi:hypothetical protein